MFPQFPWREKGQRLPSTGLVASCGNRWPKKVTDVVRKRVLCRKRWGTTDVELSRLRVMDLSGFLVFCYRKDRELHPAKQAELLYLQRAPSYATHPENKVLENSAAESHQTKIRSEQLSRLEEYTWDAGLGLF